jgi:succinate dehydrogenase / fumarate reductase, cytochrome b subunit
MTSITTSLNNSVTRKVVMALTGLFLCAFLVEHLYGNLLLYYNDNGAAFIEYSHTMVHSILIRIVEIILFAAIILHVIQAIILTRQNSKARPVKYAVNKASENSTWYSRNMGLTGSLIFFFIVVHLNTFFVSYRVIGLGADENIAWKVKDAFSSGWYSALYVFAVVILGFHLNHGFQSAFQTLGLNDKKYAPILKNIGTAFAILITLGFASFPILFYFGIAGSTY